MKNYYITFRSITYAQRGAQILRRAGIDCILRRTPKQMTKRGCGYSLQLRGNAFLPAMWASVKESLWEKENWAFYENDIVLEQHQFPE